MYERREGIEWKYIGLDMSMLIEVEAHTPLSVMESQNVAFFFYNVYVCSLIWWFDTPTAWTVSCQFFPRFLMVDEHSFCVINSV